MSFFCIVPESVADRLASVYASGSGEKGQLGNGRTGEHIATGNRTGFDIESEPSEIFFHAESNVAKHSLTHGVCVVPVRGLDDKKIVQISCGQQHSIALDEDGYAHWPTWGSMALTALPTQYCIRLGVQWLLPSGPWESKRRFDSASCSPGMSCFYFVAEGWILMWYL